MAVARRRGADSKPIAGGRRHRYAAHRTGIEGGPIHPGPARGGARNLPIGAEREGKGSQAGRREAGASARHPFLRCIRAEASRAAGASRAAPAAEPAAAAAAPAGARRGHADGAGEACRDRRRHRGEAGH